MKIVCLDLGDVHTGSAVSDINRIIATPYKTIDTKSIDEFLNKIIKEENINIIVLGYPKTMRGTISHQTQKIIDFKSEYEKKYPQIEWVLWDERLTSKSAEKFKKSTNKEDKLKLHSIAAALILNSYLEFLRIKQLNQTS